METARDTVLKKANRPKSAARYPKRMNTFVVAFAVQDSHENKPKKNTHTKRNVEISLPTNGPASPADSNTSSKTFTITAAEDISQPLVIASVSEVKIDILSDNQCSDTEKLTSHINNYLEADKNKNGQSKLIFCAPGAINKSKENLRSVRKFAKTRDESHVEKLKNVHFKYKRSRRNSARSWDKNAIKAKMKCPNTGQIKHIYSNSIYTINPKSTILKRVENVPDHMDHDSLTNLYNFNENDNLSLNSVASTAKRQSSYDSQNTLMNNSFCTVNSEDFYSMKSASSIVAEPLMSYKTEMANVTVAVALSPSNTNNFQSNIVPKDEECNINNRIDITSTHTISFPGMELTSQAPSDESSKNATNEPKDLNSFKLIEKDFSNETLIDFEKKSLEENSEQDTFKIMRTSSEFNKSNITSDFEIACYSEATLQSGNLQINTLLHSADTLGLQNNINGRDTLLDTVIKLGFYPEMTPSTSSGPNFDNEFNDVIVTENYPQVAAKDSIKLITVQNELARNVLSKPVVVENNEQLNNIDLPDEVAIKTALDNTMKSQKNVFSEEFKNNLIPTDLSEMWDRLTVTLDLALKNLEQTLADKIVKELKISLPPFLQDIKINKLLPKSSIPEYKTQEMLTDKQKLLTSNKEVIVLENHFRNENDQGLQCDLVHNQVIDQIMLKLSVEGPRTINSSQISLKSLKKPQVKEDYVDLLKPPAVDDIEVGKGDTMSVGMTTSPIPTKLNHRILHSLCSRPLTFFSENLLVITSVPTFFLILLCLYGVFTSIARSW